jgi:ribulose 1,5-bisphosphate synthetase/thiazole synthase
VIADALAAFAEVALAEGDSDFAARLEATTDSLLEEIGIPLETSEQELFEHTKVATRERVATNAYQEARVQAGATSVADIIAEATAESAVRRAL